MSEQNRSQDSLEEFGEADICRARTPQPKIQGRTRAACDSEPFLIPQALAILIQTWGLAPWLSLPLEFVLGSIPSPEGKRQQ